MSSKWDTNTLEQLRFVMDPEADAAIASVYESNSSELLRETLTKLARNDAAVLHEHFADHDAPEPLYDLINKELSHQFSETDIAMFQRTHAIWREYGMQFIYSLLFRALPYTYAAEKPANVLRMTRLIEEQSTRRIFETAQFVFDVMDSDWWTPEKRGVITALKIRLMHAAMRYMILHNTEGETWDKDKWGMPISQEDMIATNQVFSLEFFKGMELLGTPLSAEDQEAWYHTWRTIAELMGVQQNLLAPNVAEAWDLQKAVYAHLFVNTPHDSGVGLTKALVGAMEQLMLPEKLTLILMHKMMKDEDYPNAFNELLGPSFADKYPTLFVQVQPGDEHKHDEQITTEFFEELKGFHSSVSAFREKELQHQHITFGTRVHSLVDHQMIELVNIFEHVEHMNILKTISKDVQKAEDAVIGEFTQIFHHTGNAHEVQTDAVKAREDVVVRAMHAVCRVLIDLLSKYFRAGKRAGFRIDADLKEHWAIK